ncbi:defensin Cg-Defm-like [Crassostrea virginica]
MKVFVLLTVAFLLMVSADVTTGFGCPFESDRCNSHCKTTGCKTGYCEGFLKLKCTCFGCRKK